MYEDLKEYLDQHEVSLVAISKLKSNDDILNLYNKGQRVFGENRIPELLEKYESLPKDIEWHMVGHLQSKKIKKIASFVDCIQSVDKYSLLEKIDKQAAKHERVINVFLQIKIATEESKYGFDIDELLKLLGKNDIKKLENIRITGIMAMGSFTNDEEQLKSEFQRAQKCFNEIRERIILDNVNLKYLSMGMSGDYKLAIEYGSNMVRIGSLLFGPR